MVHQVVDIPRLEFVQDRDRHRAVGDSGEETDPPVRLVTGTDRDLVPFLQPALLESDMQLCDTPRHIPVGKGDSLVVGQGELLPMVLETFFQDFVY